VQKVVWNWRTFKGCYVLPARVESAVKLFNLRPGKLFRGTRFGPLCGVRMLAVLRDVLRSTKNVLYLVVGKAHTDSFMDGEAFEGLTGCATLGVERKTRTSLLYLHCHPLWCDCSARGL